MEIRSHELPGPTAMVGGLAADPARGCLWLGLAGDPAMVARYDVQPGRFAAVDLGGLLDGYSYVHRSVVVTGDRVYVGGTWIMGVRPGGRRPTPFSPGGFASLLRWISRIGALFTRCRILELAGEGPWREVCRGPFMSMDLESDGERLLRLTPRGVNRVEYTGEELVFPGRGGFVHRLVLGPGGEHLVCDESGRVELITGEVRHVLQSLKDADLRVRATPGIDGLVRTGDRYLIGGTRNRARPFVIDTIQRTMAVLDPVRTGPRASALTPDGATGAYMAAGVGRVGLYRIDPAGPTVEALGEIADGDVPCHHLHDLVSWPDGRLFGGEFYPLDVPDPPWPERRCRLWEICP